MSEVEIPERLQRILERIGNSISEIQQINSQVAVKPDPRSIQIFLAIESGLHRFNEIQNCLTIDRTVLRFRLNTMVTIGILNKQESLIAPGSYEYFINDVNGGTAGQPAIILV
jgi:DNA-binding HxlR family transcriptional regulator